MQTPDLRTVEKARQWLGDAFDNETRKEVQRLMDEDTAALTEAFYRDLEFGTGGLRGIMGVGTNRMNRYTVGMATRGLGDYLLEKYGDPAMISVVIAHDCRHNSRYFTEVSAGVLSALGIQVYIFDDLRPTPVVSFAVRQLGCKAGIMITASHNPPEYNGYKVYGDDGGQLISPDDKAVIEKVKQITDPAMIDFGSDASLIKVLNQEFDRLYLDAVLSQRLSADIIARQKDLKIVFTPIHGTTVSLGPAALRAYGFEQVFSVPEQDVVSGDFPTVVSPNPEEPAALKMAIERGRGLNADLIMGTDPDGDRVGLVIRDLQGEYVLLNGNQTASLMIWYLLEQWKQREKFQGGEFIVKTIVTSGLLKKLAEAYGIECFDVLTGFKYIAEIIRRLEGKQQFIAGGEESYGYLVGDYVRDKDAIVSCCIMAEAAAWARDQGKSLYELLIDMYMRFGLYVENLVSITKKGKAGLEEIQAIMDKWRHQQPDSIAGKRIVLVRDYASAEEKDLLSGVVRDMGLPASNVLQFVLEDGSLITMRPSGTEPKIKFYFGVQTILNDKEAYQARRTEAEEQINALIRAMDID